MPALSMPGTFDPCHPDDPKAKYVKIVERYKTGLLFKISKCGTAPSYLLGTMHSDDPALISLLHNAYARLVYAKSASFEIDFDDNTVKTVRAAMFYPKNGVESLQETVGMDLYNRFVQAMQIIHPESSQENYYNMKPWAAAVMLQEPPNTDDGVALDLRLERLAQSRDIPVYGLETATEQLSVFEDVPVDKQVEFLKDAVDHYQRIDKENKELVKLYTKEDLNGLENLSDGSFDMISDKNFATELKINLVDKRNQLMVTRMQPRLDAGSAFIAVGALHLTGDEGILKALEDKGYFIGVVSDDGS